MTKEEQLKELKELVRDLDLIWEAGGDVDDTIMALAELAATEATDDA